MPNKRRLIFQAEFRDSLLNGTKTATMRQASSPNVKALLPGDIVIGVEGLFTRVVDGFAQFDVTEVQILSWGEVTDAHLARTRATREWYERRYGAAVHGMLWKFIGLRLIEGGTRG